MLYGRLISSTLSEWRAILWLYLLQGLASLPMGLGIYSWLGSGLGQSAVTQDMDGSYLRTIWTDLIHHHLGALSPWLWVGLGGMLLYLIAYMVWQGGVISRLATSHRGGLWTEGMRLLPAIASVTGLTILCHILWTVAVVGIYLSTTTSPLDGVLSERPWVVGLMVVAGIWLLGISILSVWGQLAKIRYCSDPMLSITKSCRQALRLMGSCRLVLYLAILVYGIIWVTLVCIDRWLAGGDVSREIWLMGWPLVPQQVIILIGAGLQVSWYGCLYTIARDETVPYTDRG